MTEQLLWDFLTAGMTAQGRYKLANYLAHGLKPVGVTGVLLTRKDWAEMGELVLVSRDGRDSREPQSEELRQAVVQLLRQPEDNHEVQTMSKVNFTLKTRKSLPNGVSQRKIYACRSIEVEWTLDNKISVTACGLSGGTEGVILQLDHPEIDPTNTYAEIIVENMQGKTTERWTAERIHGYVNASVSPEASVSPRQALHEDSDRPR